MFDVDFIFVGASGVHAEVDDVDVFVFYVTVHDFFYCVCVFVNGLVHLLGLGDDILKVTYRPELLFFFGPFDWVSMLLLLVFV